MKNMYLHTPRKSIFKLLTLFVACTIIFSSLTVLGFGVMAEDAEDTNGIDAWDGSIATKFAGDGDGTEGKPFLISNGAELAYLRSLIKSDTSNGGATKDKYFKLTADIYLNDITVENWQETAQSLEWTNRKFEGHLDGDGHIVYGLYQTEEQYAALIPVATRAASVKNLGIRNAVLSGKPNITDNAANQASGSIVGSVASSPAYTNEDYYFIMENCFAEDVSVEADDFVGGLIGSGTKIKMENCYFKGTLNTRHKETEATTNCGAFLGAATNASSKLVTVTNCYSVGSDPYIIAYASSTKTEDVGTFTNVYTNVESKSANEKIITLSDEEMKGSAAKTSMGAFDFENDWIALTGTTPELRKFHNIPATNWDGTTSKPTVGEGTAINPYQITNANELAWMVKCSIDDTTVDYVDTEGKNYILANDIVVNDTSSEYWKDYVTKDWYDASGNTGFMGRFDGRGHKISGLYSSSGTSTYTALFPSVLHGAVIANVGVVNSSLHNGNSSGNAAAIVGKTTYTASEPLILVSNCYADNVELSLSSESGRIAGIVANGQGVEVRNCWSNIKAYRSGAEASDAYGIVGYSWSNTDKPAIKIINCYSIGYDICSLKNDKAVCTVENAYTSVDTAISEGVTVLELTAMQGENATTNMSALDFGRVWISTEGNTPQLNPAHNGDIDFDGDLDEIDKQSLRSSLIGSADMDLFQNVNRDDTIDICDLVSLYNIQK